MQWFFYQPQRDPQAAIPAGYCEVCGREVYAPEGICLYCLVHGL